MTRATSSRSSLTAFASWDQDSSCWRTCEDTLLSDSTPFSGRWPTSGMTRDGCAFELPTWEPPTDVSACSSSPLLMTPVASEGTKPSNSMGTARRKRTGQVFLTNQIVDLAGHDPVEALLPTPVADNSRGLPSKSTDYSPLPNAVVALLPTPAVNDMGAGKTVEDWDAWTERMKAAHGNGNGHGKSLAIEAQRLLPTPTVGDSKSARNSTAVRHRLPPTGLHAGDTLTDILVPRSTGDSTPPPSTDGPQSWDVPLPLQLSPEPKASPDSAPGSSSS